MTDFEGMAQAVISGQLDKLKILTQTALEEGISAKEILHSGLTPGMDYVGVQMRKGNMFIPEVLLSARAMQHSLDILRPRLAEVGARMTGKVVIGTVQGDLHDIGKTIVAMMLRGAGFEVHDLGVDVAPEAFAAAVDKDQACIVGVSALLTTTMRNMECVQ